MTENKTSLEEESVAGDALAVEEEPSKATESVRTKPVRGLPFLRGRFARDGKGKKVRRRRRRPRLPKRPKLPRPKPPTNFKQELFTVPNILTYLRIGMLPLILIVLDRDSRLYSFMAALLFAVASFTDLFDGYFARKLNQVTILGKLLDPLADKLMVSATLIIMVPMGRAASWIVILILAREFAITGLRGIAASEGMVIAAAPMAKYKTMYQMLAIFCLLLHYPYTVNFYGMFELVLNYHRIGTFFLYLALALSILSGIDYFVKFGVAINSKYQSSTDSSTHAS